jgi:hypothetical protein
MTLLQRLTPLHLQGRTHSAAELVYGAPQTLSIALGAVLVTVLDHRLLLLVQALVAGVAGAYLLAVSHAPRLVHTRATWEAT